MCFQEASLLDHLSVEGNLKFGYQRTPPAQRRMAWGPKPGAAGHCTPFLARMPHTLSGGGAPACGYCKGLGSQP